MITITQQHCERCTHTWMPRVPEPVECPACKSRLWTIPKSDGASTPKAIGEAY